MPEVPDSSSPAARPLSTDRSWILPIAVLLSALYLPTLSTPLDFGDPTILQATREGRTVSERCSAIARAEPSQIVSTAFAEMSASIVGEASIGWRMFKWATIFVSACGLLMLMHSFGFSAMPSVGVGIVALWGPLTVMEFRAILSAEAFGVGFALWGCAAGRLARSAKSFQGWDILGVVTTCVSVGCGCWWALPAWATARCLDGGRALVPFTFIWACGGLLPTSAGMPTNVAVGFVVGVGLAALVDRPLTWRIQLSHGLAAVSAFAVLLTNIACQERYAAQQRTLWQSFDHISANLTGPAKIAWSVDDGLATADAHRFQRMLDHRHQGKVRIGMVDRDGVPTERDGLPALVGDPTYWVVSSRRDADPMGRWETERSVVVGYWAGRREEQCHLIRYHPETEAQAAWLRQQIEQQLPKILQSGGEELAEPRK